MRITKQDQQALVNYYVDNTGKVPRPHHVANVVEACMSFEDIRNWLGVPPKPLDPIARYYLDETGKVPYPSATQLKNYEYAMEQKHIVHRVSSDVITVHVKKPVKVNLSLINF